MIIDISPPVGPELAVWPGDTPASREVLCDLSRGDPITLSTLRATVHLGAHADAPSHTGLDEVPIDEVPLEPYVGPCHVVEARARRGQRVSARDLELPDGAERVLIRTGTYADPRRFEGDFAALEPSLVDELAARGVQLVGIDTPSVDLVDSKELPSHARFRRHGVAILEGLVLEGVAPGLYELIALPLRLIGFDASPVRAVLRSAATRP